MLIPITFIIAFLFGYLYGYKIKPNRQLRAAIRDVKEECKAALEEGNKGVYKTLITDQNKVSELLVEIKELAVTESGKVKVQYLNAHYNNPEFRTSKGDNLLNEVRNLLGDYLPVNEIEWYNNSDKHEALKSHIISLENKYKKQLRA